MHLALPEPVPPALGAMSCATGLVYGSMCSGIEAATVAWEPLGWRPAFYAEIEPFPSAVLAHHYPAVPNLGDMAAIDGSAWRGKIDVLVGGTPCQAFSVAGLRKSLDDARGNLALKFVELADAIDPAWIVWENVPGVLSTRDNAFGCLLGGLAGEDGPVVPPGGKWSDAGVVVGPARTVAWRVLDAQYFGLAQRRRRVFVVAGAGDRADPVQVLLEREGVRRDHPPRREAEQGVAPTLDARAGRSGETSFATSGGLIAEAFGGNNTSGPIDIATALNACASASGRMDFESETFVATTLRARDLARGVDSDCTDTLIAHSLRGESFDASEDGTGRGTPLVPVTLAFTQNQRDEVRPLKIAGALAAEPETKQQTYVAFDCKAGTGFQTIEADGVTPTLRAMNALGRENAGGQLAIQHDMAVRRLTPRECERLQGFPDDYTRIPWRGKPADRCPDGPRYRGLGNSMATTVMTWLGRRIQATGR